MPLPDTFHVLGETWKRDYPDWEYILWNDKMMNDFINENYPQYVEIYNSFPYDVQRWDAIRYLIMDKMGGMYVDCDYESIEPMNELLADKTCCFAMEPASHKHHLNSDLTGQVFSNAMMLSIPGHPFMRELIDAVFGEHSNEYLGKVKGFHVMVTTGPYLILDLYRALPVEKKDAVYLIPAKYVMPFSIPQAHRYRYGEMSNELENCIQEAYAVHYFFGDWLDDRI